MNARDSIQGQKLKALEQWRQLELDQAHAEHAKLLSFELRKEQAVHTVQTAIADSDQLAREATSINREISVDRLLRVRQYALHQADELKQAEALLQEARKQTSAAKQTVLSKHKNVSIVERLQKRRGIQAAKKVARREQRRLDDQALLRLSATRRSTSEGE